MSSGAASSNKSLNLPFGFIGTAAIRHQRKALGDSNGTIYNKRSRKWLSSVREMRASIDADAPKSRRRHAHSAPRARIAPRHQPGAGDARRRFMSAMDAVSSPPLSRRACENASSWRDIPRLKLFPPGILPYKMKRLLTCDK